MPLTVLTDNNVKDLLMSLTKDDALMLQQNLCEALHSYSTGDTNSPCCSSYQPARIVMKKHGVTTLFMPASTGTSVGMKIVSLETPEAPIAKVSGSSTADSMSGLTLTPASTMSSQSSVSGQSFQPQASVASSQSTTPRGTIAIMDTQGYPTGIVNAEELTAFRTALAATIVFNKRINVHTITVFGAGKQAYWHIRLALLFRGDQIKHINIINRSFDRSIKLMKAFNVDELKSNEWKDVKFSAMSPEFGDYGRLLKEEVRKADVIFCCTPSLEPLFPAECELPYPPSIIRGFRL